MSDKLNNLFSERMREFMKNGGGQDRTADLGVMNAML